MRAIDKAEVLRDKLRDELAEELERSDEEGRRPRRDRLMKPTKFTIQGDLTGELWWPMGEPAFAPVVFDFARKGRPFVHEASSLREAVEIMMEHGGDFSSAPRLARSSVLVLERDYGHRSARRWFPITIFKSIVPDYVEAESCEPS